MHLSHEEQLLIYSERAHKSQIDYVVRDCMAGIYLTALKEIRDTFKGPVSEMAEKAIEEAQTVARHRREELQEKEKKRYGTNT